LIEMKAVRWFDDETMGTNYSLEEIPEDLKEKAEEWKEKLVESVAEIDDAILERYFDDPDSITKEEMLTVIRRATIDGVIVPMMCGSAFKNKGVQRLLDSVCAFLPSPLDKGEVTGKNPVIDKEVTRTANIDEPLAALAFKIATDPFVGRLAYMRVYSGKIEAGSQVLNTRTGKKERI
ncbi:MAG: elongation factor G, partial [Bacteroidetes bacterium]|nr:elongation factor G [Bacteroidota bacterium]